MKFMNCFAHSILGALTISILGCVPDPGERGEYPPECPSQGNESEPSPVPDTVNGDWWANIHATYYEVIGSSTREVTQVDIVIGTLRTDLLLDEWEELLYRVEIVPMSEDTKLIDDSADGYDCEGHSYSTYQCEARRVLSRIMCLKKDRENGAYC